MRFLAVVLVLVAPCFGQAGRAELFGTVQDPSGLPVANAKVQAEDQATTACYSVVSDSGGRYHLLGLAAGSYVLTVELPGFRTYRQSSITLRVDDRTSLDVELEVGQAAQSIDVIAAAPCSKSRPGRLASNPVRGPGLQEADLMLGKTFRLMEQVQLEFRAEAFNLSNTPPLNDPSGNFGSAGFGTITSAGNPRDFKFAAKVHYWRGCSAASTSSGRCAK